MNNQSGVKRAVGRGRLALAVGVASVVAASAAAGSGAAAVDAAGSVPAAASADQSDRGGRALDRPFAMPGYTERDDNGALYVGKGRAGSPCG